MTAGTKTAVPLALEIFLPKIFLPSFRIGAGKLGAGKFFAANLDGLKWHSWFIFLGGALAHRFSTTAYLQKNSLFAERPRSATRGRAHKPILRMTRPGGAETRRPESQARSARWLW